jgi:tetratricopeptide (TPR) repeat protein
VSFGRFLRALGAAAVMASGLGCRAPLLVCPKDGGTAWTEVDTPHFVIKTDVDPPAARAMAGEFEELHTALGRMMHRQDTRPGERVDVVVFAAPEAFHAFDDDTDHRMAYAADHLPFDVEPSPTLVMYHDDEEAGRETFLHELTHRFLHEHFAELPRWLDEGMASLSETLQIKGRHGLLGAAWRRPREAVLWTDHHGVAGGRMIPVASIPSLDELVAADRAAFYRDLDFGPDKGEKVVANYAGAFRFVHLLVNGPADYRQRFSSYLQALEQGVKPSQALSAAFASVDADRLHHDYRAYLSSQDLPVADFDLGPPEPPPAVAVRPMSDAEVHVLWSRLYPHRKEFLHYVHGELDLALAHDPSAIEAHLRRALVLASEERFPESRADLATALSGNPDDPRYLLGKLAVYDAINPPAFQCGDGDAEVESTVTHLAHVAVTGAELGAVAAYHEQHGQAAAGLRFAQEAVKRAPLSWSCQDTYSRLLLQTGDVRGARAANERALALLPERSRETRPLRQQALLAAFGELPATASLAGAGGRGTLTSDTVAAVLRGAEGSFRCCYELAHRSTASLAGEVSIALTVQPDGSVSQGAVTGSSLARPEVERCVLREVQKLRFPPHESGPVPLTHRLGFHPAPARRSAP